MTGGYIGDTVEGNLIYVSFASVSVQYTVFPLLVKLNVNQGMCEKQHVYSSVYLIKYLFVISAEGVTWVVVTS